MSWSAGENDRYARQRALPELGEKGQRRLRSASVLVVGMGALGSAIDGRNLAYGDLAEVPLAKTKDWAHLPPRLARELRAARREVVSEEYRSMIEMYYKVLAERNAGK